MFNISWGEMLLIGAVALIVIGPKELPAALRTVGRTIGKVKRMASEFQGQFNEALREADLDKIRKDVQSMNKTASASFNPVKTIRDEVKGAIAQPGATTATVATASSGAARDGAELSASSSAVTPEPPNVEKKPGPYAKAKPKAEPAEEIIAIASNKPAKKSAASSQGRE